MIYPGLKIELREYLQSLAKGIWDTVMGQHTGNFCLDTIVLIYFFVCNYFLVCLFVCFLSVKTTISPEHVVITNCYGKGLLEFQTLTT